jgi:putative SOS response-associated peptidase YedK
MGSHPVMGEGPVSREPYDQCPVGDNHREVGVSPCLKKQRCLIPADGFFEWRKEGNRKLPMHFSLSSGETFAFAGLYNLWTSPAGETIYTCTIITTTANNLVKPFHDRMPVILTKSREDVWLDPSIEDNETVLPLLKAYDADAMETWEVTAKMNRPEYDRPENVRPI